MLGLAFLFMAGLGAMVEERGLSSRSILNNPDLRPQTETATKFADVKGVDEAKVGWLGGPASRGVLGSSQVAIHAMRHCCDAAAILPPSVHSLRSRSWRRLWRTCATRASSPPWAASCPRACCWWGRPVSPAALCCSSVALHHCGVDCLKVADMYCSRVYGWQITRQSGCCCLSSMP